MNQHPLSFDEFNKKLIAFVEGCKKQEEGVKIVRTILSKMGYSYVKDLPHRLYEDVVTELEKIKKENEK